MATRFSILAWKNSQDREDWRATFHKVPKTRIELSDRAHMGTQNRHIPLYLYNFKVYRLMN